MECNKVLHLLDEKLTLFSLFYTFSFVSEAKGLFIKLEYALNIPLLEIPDPFFEFSSSHLLSMNSTHPSSTGNSMGASTPVDSSATYGGSDSLTGTYNPPVTSGSSNRSVTYESSTTLTTNPKGTEKSSEQPETNSIEAQQAKARSDYNKNLQDAYNRLAETRKLLEQTKDTAYISNKIHLDCVKKTSALQKQLEIGIEDDANLASRIKSKNALSLKKYNENVVTANQKLEESISVQEQNKKGCVIDGEQGKKLTEEDSNRVERAKCLVNQAEKVEETAKMLASKQPEPFKAEIDKLRMRIEKAKLEDEEARIISIQDKNKESISTIEHVKSRENVRQIMSNFKQDSKKLLESSEKSNES
jgi:hypothetical protein